MKTTVTSEEPGEKIGRLDNVSGAKIKQKIPPDAPVRYIYIYVVGIVIYLSAYLLGIRI
jgi:hypothetical protein